MCDAYPKNVCATGHSRCGRHPKTIMLTRYQPAACVYRIRLLRASVPHSMPHPPTHPHHPQLSDHLRSQPTEADLIAASLRVLQDEGASEADKVLSLSELQVLVEPIDKANGERHERWLVRL